MIWRQRRQGKWTTTFEDSSYILYFCCYWGRSAWAHKQPPSNHFAWFVGIKERSRCWAKSSWHSSRLWQASLYTFPSIFRKMAYGLLNYHNRYEVTWLQHIWPISYILSTSLQTILTVVRQISGYRYKIAMDTTTFHKLERNVYHSFLWNLWRLSFPQLKKLLQTGDQGSDHLPSLKLQWHPVM